MKIRNQNPNCPGPVIARSSPGYPFALCSCSQARGETTESPPQSGSRDQPPEFKIPEPLRWTKTNCAGRLKRAICRRQDRQGRPKTAEGPATAPVKGRRGLAPNLGLLIPLAQGKISAEMRSVPLKTEHLKSRMLEIIREHIAIIEASRNLAQVAARGEKTQTRGLYRSASCCGHGPMKWCFIPPQS